MAGTAACSEMCPPWQAVVTRPAPPTHVAVVSAAGGVDVRLAGGGVVRAVVGLAGLTALVDAGFAEVLVTARVGRAGGVELRRAERCGVAVVRRALGAGVRTRAVEPPRPAMTGPCSAVRLVPTLAMTSQITKAAADTATAQAATASTGRGGLTGASWHSRRTIPGSLR